MRLLKSREAAAAVDVKTWPTIIDTGVVHGLKDFLKFCVGVIIDFQRDCPTFQMLTGWLLRICLNIQKNHPRYKLGLSLFTDIFSAFVGLCVESNFSEKPCCRQLLISLRQE